MKSILQELLRTLSTNFPDIPFEVRFWDGVTESFGDGAPAFALTFNTKNAARNIFKRGSMGFREEYVAGNIDVAGDFKELMRLGMDPRVQQMELPFKTKAGILIQYLTSLNTIGGSLRNIAHHYDLGNDFYQQHLDESLTYSCAYFRKEDDTLEQAQAQKYEQICRKLGLREGERLLDIGCGWGGMLIYAAHHYGVDGVGCTLSDQQAAYARERVAQEGLEKKITILLQDYRNIQEQVDKFVSIGMLEHVGKGYIRLFMEKLSALLKPGGVGLLHTVGKEHNTPGDAWTAKYIFPGTYVPLLDHVIRVMGDKGFVPIDVENLRLHYAATLDEWARRFESNAKKIEEMFDGRFVRMWRAYLHGSAAAFRWGDVRVYQILFTNGLNNGMPMTREHFYRE
jgi:cyclopropane-fatty-acyl-phospholipid synthase